MCNTLDAQTLQTLKSILSNDSILYEGTEEYEAANSSYFSAFANEVKPALILKPQTTEQVQQLIRALRQHPDSGDCGIAIRGGGHNPSGRAANVQGGITVDMRDFKGVSLNQDKSIVSIRAGETWSSVYQELEKFNITTTGARASRVGVTGFILGGGLSIFSTQTGFACDSVTEFEIVMPSGDIIYANSEQHTELWTALKGGLNNFGIVTSFKMKTFESKDIWGGVTFYLPTAFPDLMQRACDFVFQDMDPNTHVMCSAGYGYGHQGATCVMYHTLGDSGSPSLQPFITLEPQIKDMSTMRVSTHSSFSDELSNFSQNGVRQFWASITIKPDIALMKTFYEMWQQALDAIQDASGLTFTLGFHALTKTLLSNSKAAGGNAMNIPAEDGPLFIVLINPTWSMPSDDQRILARVHELVDELKRTASAEGLLHRYIFTNYAREGDEVIHGYGEESTSKLREITKRYDPEGWWQRQVSGAFKLPSEGI
ncbi:hypothetical protein B0I35DRAFT_460820 [Stachybotrys elegans]|uniref:FAD-binding PCMH-type domain-containing protein n=1 Tax=Stachybotrys elegans TaxID=80388 RepID=A0A8K0SRF3_9HYPO|nr:hypothetical protein B0I35DRAFT_460820 [Stachybotrys elegans]